jgi:hypothetical protein
VVKIQPPNQTIAFIINFSFHDHHLLPRLIPQVRSHYPDKTIIAVSDGYWDDDLELLFINHNIQPFIGNRIKLLEYGAEWVERYLQLFLRTKADLLIRIDPDCIMHDRFLSFPDADFFGTPLSEVNPIMINTGCCGLRRRAIAGLIKSGILKGDRYRQPRFTYDRFGRHRWEHEQERSEQVLCSDRVFQDLIIRMRWTVEEWDAVKILWRDIPQFTANFAVTHPHPIYE